MRSLRLTFAVTAMLWVATTAALTIDYRLVPQSAVAIGSEGGQFVYSPAGAGRSFRGTFEIDPSAPLMASGPQTYRAAGDTATITSSFARFQNPGFITPRTGDLLSGLPTYPGPITEFSAIDVSWSFFDNDQGPDGSLAFLRLFRQFSFTQEEAGQSRISYYLLSYELSAHVPVNAAGAITPIDANSLALIVGSVQARDVVLYEEAASYLESGCGSPTGCFRSDASGFRYVWRAVPEPSSIALVLLAGCVLLALRGGMQRASGQLLPGAFVAVFLGYGTV